MNGSAETGNGHYYYNWSWICRKGVSGLESVERGSLWKKGSVKKEKSVLGSV